MDRILRINSKKIVKRLANSSLKTERRRNIMVIISIILATFLISMCGVGIFASSQRQKVLSEDTFEVMYHNVDKNSIKLLRKQSEIERVGVTYSWGTWKNSDGKSMAFSYMDEDALYISRKQFHIEQGKLPSKKNEIAVSEQYLKKYAPDSKIGDKISMDVGNETHNFLISAILKFENRDNNTYIFLVGDQFITQEKGYQENGYQVYAHFRNVNMMSKEDVEKIASSISQEYHLDYEYSFLYLNSKRNQSIIDYIPFILLAVVVLIAGITVIQSIFRISISEKIRYYGQLRTVGATQKQIKEIVKKEGEKLTFIGMPIGILLGDFFGMLIGGVKAEPEVIIGTLVISVCVAIICMIMVRCSIRKPVKIAANTSPLEAIRFVPFKNEDLNRKKFRQRITPSNIAKINLGRDKKRTISTIFSLAFGGILLLVSASLLVSYSAESQVKTKVFANGGKFRIYLNDEYLKVAEQIKENPLNEELRQKILAIDGVESVIKLRNTIGEVSFVANGVENEGILCDVISEDSKEENSAFIKEHLISGKFPCSKSEILISDTIEFISIGETINITYNDRKIPVTVTGIYDGSYIGTSNGTSVADDSYILITEELADTGTMLSDIKNYSYTWEILVDSKKIQNVTGNLANCIKTALSGVSICSFEEEVEYFENQMKLLFGGIQAISWLIFAFGVVNLINMTLSNQISRKKEIAVMRSIGLTNSQLYHIFIIEGISYIVVSFTIILLIGIPISVLLCKYLGNLLGGGIMIYKFPMTEMLMYILVLVVLEFILAAWCISNAQKHSLVSQISDID